MIGIGNDHAGYELKKRIVDHLRPRGFEVKDYGTCSSDHADYPDYGLKVAEAVAGKECDLGIVICSTGIGISISANKVPGIRAALCTNSYMARLSRQHNNANVLALGANVTGTGHALEIVDAWLESEFSSDERHHRRVRKIYDIDKKYMSNRTQMGE